MSVSKRFFRLVFIVIVTLVLTFTWWQAKYEPGQASAQETSLPGKIEARLVPSDYAEVSASSAGRVDQVYVEEGQEVQTGDLLLRIDGYEQFQVEVEAARLDVILAQQAIDNLTRNAGVMFAEATLEVAQVDKVRALAADRLASLNRSKSPPRIAQAYANLLLAERGLDHARDDLIKARQKFDNNKSLIWWFINKRYFRLKLTLLEGVVATQERRLVDSQDKYSNLLTPLDAVDLLQAEADLADANARLEWAIRQQQELIHGPDPDDLQVAQARLNAAKSRLAAAEINTRSFDLRAPISGTVIEILAKAGEWTLAGQRLIIIADFTSWLAETEDLDEFVTMRLAPGMPVRMELDAYPGEELHGNVKSISLYAIEEDGDVYYLAKILLQQADPRFRWGMTTRVFIE